MIIGMLVGFHVITGMTALFAGAASLATPKGSDVHRVFGNVFFLSMLSMTTSSAYLALVREQADNIVVGAFTLYLVATAWLTVIRQEQQTGFVEIVACIGGLVTAATAVRFGWEAANSPVGLKGGVAAESFYAMAVIVGCFAAFDIKAILSGGVVGTQRILRHLWRMCFAMCIATLSLFVGQSQLFPAFLRESYLLAGPVILIVALTAYWLIHVKFSKRYQ